MLNADVSPVVNLNESIAIAEGAFIGLHEERDHRRFERLFLATIVRLTCFGDGLTPGILRRFVAVFIEDDADEIFLDDRPRI